MAIDPRQVADVSGALKQLEGFGKYKASVENRLANLEAGGTGSGGGSTYKDSKVIAALGMDYATGVKTYGFEGTEEEWNQAIASITSGDNQEDVTKCWSYGLRSINISTNQPPESPTPGYATMWQVEGSTTQEYTRGGSTIGNGTAIGLTVNSTANDVGFMLAAGYCGLYYRHKVGNTFGNRIVHWGLLKDRYGFTVDSRNIACSRICSLNEGETSDEFWKKFWVGVEDGLSTGIVESGTGSGDNFTATNHWFYIALKFRQTESHNVMYRMQFNDNDWRNLVGSSYVPTNVNRNVNGTYDGFGIILAWCWQNANWFISGMNPDGTQAWGGVIDIRNFSRIVMAK